MCGICGVVGKIGVKEENAFKIMLQLDVLRGKDSTGMFAVTSNGDVMSAKEAWLPQDFLESRGAKEIFKKSLKVLVGHNRYATVGSVNKANAHPFEFDNIIGVHNGTTTKSMFYQHDKFTVDSEALFWHIENKGIEDAWKNITGAASIVYYNSIDKSLNLARNKERPMEMAISKDKNTLFFASESWMITVACAKAGIELSDEGGSTDLNTLYTIKPFGKDGKINKKELEVYKAPVAYLGSNRRSVGSVKEAKTNFDLHVGDEVVFKFTGLNTVGGSTVGVIETLETAKPIVGRVYMPTNSFEVNSAFLEHGRKYQGRIISVANYSGGQGFSVSFQTIHEVLDFDDDDEQECVVFSRSSKSFTREQFEKAQGVDNTCSWCASPVDFDLLDFKGAGTSVGVQRVVCEECLMSFGDEVESYCDVEEVYHA